jgi:hypothetical protein
MCPCHGWPWVGHGALVRPLEPVGAVVWLEEPPRPSLPVLFLPLWPPPLPLLRFFVILGPVATGAAVAAMGRVRWCGK